jgi:hypothetical protein
MHKSTASSTAFHVSVADVTSAKQADHKEHKYNLTQGMFEKSKSAQHTCEIDLKICWKEAKLCCVGFINPVGVVAGVHCPVAGEVNTGTWPYRLGESQT